jgi:hypothetical protein
LLSLENIKDIPKMMNFWTGFPKSLMAFDWFSVTTDLDGSSQSSFRSTYIRFTHELKIEETDPTEIENLTAKSSTNKSTFERCTEIFVQNPSKLDARKQVYSNYKHHNTFKFLVGVSPQMGITYVSRMYDFLTIGFWKFTK